MIVHPVSRLISPASKVMVICLAILWNPQLLAAADKNTTKEFSICMEQSQGVTPKMFDCLADVEAISKSEEEATRITASLDKVSRNEL